MLDARVRATSWVPGPASPVYGVVVPLTDGS